MLPLLNVAATDETLRGEAMRYLGELMWKPDAILFNPRLQWRIMERRILSVATGEGPRRSEARLLLDQSGDAVRFEAVRGWKETPSHGMAGLAAAGITGR